MMMMMRQRWRMSNGSHDINDDKRLLSVCWSRLISVNLHQTAELF